MSATLAAGPPVGRLLAEMRRWTPYPLKKMAEPPFSATQALRSEWLFLPPLPTFAVAAHRPDTELPFL
jgi:hypothetical protein